MTSKETSEATPGFSLTSTTSLFSSKSNDIFAGLDALEQKHNAYQKTQASSESLEDAGVMKSDPVEEDEGKKLVRHNNSRHHDSAPYHNQRSNRRSWNSNSDCERNLPKGGFRRPRPPPRTKQFPDPEKWASYSLGDVSDKDLSNRTNTRAALDFLFERKQERERQERLDAGLPAEEEKFETETAACSKGLISFSRSKSKAEKKMEIDDDKPSHTDRDKLQGKIAKSFNEESEAVSSTINTEPSQADEISSSSMSDQVNSGDEKSGSETVFKFKSRKNVRKQIRRRDDDDVDESEET